MFERYTEKAKLTIFRAKHQADEVGSREISSAHILLALLKDAALAEQVLGGISLPQLLAEILALQPQQSRRLGPGDLPLSKEARQIVGYAIEEADKLGSPYVGNGLIWFGLLQAKSSDVAKVLRQKGISVETVRIRIKELALQENAEAESLLPPRARVQDPNEQRIHRDIRDAVEQGGDRQALKLIDDLLADPKRDRDATLRDVWFTATALAKSIGDLQLVRHYCEERLLSDRDDPMALYVLADCLHQQGHIEEAKGYAVRAFANLNRSGSKVLPDALKSQWPDLSSAK